MKMKKVIALILIALFAFSCSGTYNLTQSSKESELSGIRLDNMMVLVMYPDSDIESRVALEKSVTDHLKAKGLKASPGFNFIPSYNQLESQASNIIEIMESNGFDNVLVIDPLSYKKYSDTDNYNSAMAFRAIGWETAELFTNVSALVEQSQASNFIMGVALWNKPVEKFVWEGTYNVNAPDGYDLDYAKLYSVEFIDQVLKDIRTAQN